MKNIILIFFIIIFITIFVFYNYKEKFKNLKLEKTNINSPYNLFGNNFVIYIDKTNNIIYKKIKKIKIKNIDSYKKNIYNLKNIKIIKKYIYYVDNIYIENDGSYFSIYMKDNVSIYDIIKKKKKITYQIKYKIIYNLNNIKKDLILYTKNNILIGDWNPSNLLYDYETNRIYNIDYEGFSKIAIFKMQFFPYFYTNINNYFNMLINKIRYVQV